MSAREAAASSLDHELVVKIYRLLFDDLRSWIDGQRVNGFAATLQLLFDLLRYRVVQRNFLAPSSTADADVRAALVEAVDEASQRLRGEGSFLSGRRQETALDVLKGLKEFLDFRGSMNIIEKLSQLDEEPDPEDGS